MELVSSKELKISGSNTNGLIVQGVEFKWNNQEIKKWPIRLRQGVFRMAFKIAAVARERAPYVTGALSNSIHTDTTSEENAIFVIAGGPSYMSRPPRNARQITRVVDYAAKREKGPNRDPTTEHYMENALKDVMQGDWQTEYFGDITK